MQPETKLSIFNMLVVHGTRGERAHHGEGVIQSCVHEHLIEADGKPITTSRVRISDALKVDLANENVVLLSVGRVKALEKGGGSF